MSNRKATKAGERICIDTTGPYPANLCGTQYWMCGLYDYTDMSWLHFEKRKSEMDKYVSNLFGIFKCKGIKVEYLHCDNSVEHISKLIILC